MTNKRPIIRLQTAGTTRVPYGRARLTLKRWGDVSSGKVGEAVAAYERGEVDAAGVAWAFVRDRISATSPSFEWNKADLDRLIGLVAEASTEPKLIAKAPESLAPELVAAAEKERQLIKEASKRIRQLADDVLRVPRGLIADIAKAQELRDKVLGKVGGLGDVFKSRQQVQGILDQTVGIRGNIAQLLGEPVHSRETARIIGARVKPVPVLARLYWASAPSLLRGL